MTTLSIVLYYDYILCVCDKQLKIRTFLIGGFTVTSYDVSRGHPVPLVGKRSLAGGFRVYFCLDSCLVYINFAHTQDHD